MATRAVGEIPSSSNLRLQNLVESQLEMTKTESCLIALSAKFALKSPPPCLSPRTPYILAPRSVYAFPLLPLKLGRYVATELLLEPGRYVGTELWLELGRYVATERNMRLAAA
ncbi:hypothetical protein F2Q69_00052149 [Brassica cretica]|uniref:Uncharacterized protein n=1 Tax=Brassica cretica TaxID=69181 RepID=A0A8S9N567_BRACR|nr:hypothetical protein F2Q69_00052149 [Brassica cretica]